MSKKPQTLHAKALAAFVTGKISKEEYQECLLGYARVNGCYLEVWRYAGLCRDPRKHMIHLPTPLSKRGRANV